MLADFADSWSERRSVIDSLAAAVMVVVAALVAVVAAVEAGN